MPSGPDTDLYCLRGRHGANRVSQRWTFDWLRPPGLVFNSSGTVRSLCGPAPLQTSPVPVMRKQMASSAPPGTPGARIFRNPPQTEADPMSFPCCVTTEIHPLHSPAGFLILAGTKSPFMSFYRLERDYRNVSDKRRKYATVCYCS